MKKTKSFHFLPILIGLCFFFNPYYAVIDFLPDFIGCLLIAFGLIPLARMHTSMREAKRAFFRLALVDFVKDLILLFVFGNSAAGEQEILVLIIAFVSATLYTTLTVMAMRSLFDGLDWVASTYDCKALYMPKTYKKSRTELLAYYTTIFIILKEVLLLLPEFASLFNSSYTDSDLIRIYDYIGIMRFLVIIPVLIAGIWWLVLLISYFVRLHREKEFLQKIAAHYSVYLAEHPSIHIIARYTVSFLLIGIGTLFFTDFYLDNYNIMPDTVGGILVLLGILLLGLPLKKRLVAVLTAGLYTIIATFSSRQSYSFASQYMGSDITRSEEAANLYQTMWVSSLAEFLCFLVFLLFLLLALRAVLVKWGGYIPEHTNADFEKRHEMKMHEEFDWLFIKCYILGFVSALLSFFFDYFQNWPDTKQLRYFSHFMEALWIPDFLLGLFFGVYMIYVIGQVMQKIKERFQFE